MPKNNKQKKGDKNKKGKPKTGPYQPTAVVKGKDLRKLVRSLAKREYKPQVKAARGQFRGLRGMLNQQVASQQALGGQAQANTAEYYKQLATQEAKNSAYQKALSGRLKTGVDQAGGQAQEGISKASEAATAALGDSSAKFGNVAAPAKQQLAEMIANQQGWAGRESQALSGQATLQGGSYEALQKQMASAAAMRGGQQISDQGRATQQNVMNLQQQFLPDLISAKTDIAGLKATKGGVKNEIYRRLLGEERQYGLSKGALGIDRKSLKADQSVNPTVKYQAKQNKKLARIKAAIEKERAKGAAADNIKLAKLKKQLWKNQGKGGGGKGKGGAGRNANKKKAQQKALSKLRILQKEHPKWSKGRYRDELIAAGLPKAAVNAALRKQQGFPKGLGDIKDGWNANL